jgi:hypothetical protein
MGAAYYRAGRFADAVAQLEVRKSWRGWPPVNNYFLAMALHRVGRTEQARAAFASAVDMANQTPPTAGGEANREELFQGLLWRIILDLLRREAEAVLGVK